MEFEKRPDNGQFVTDELIEFVADMLVHRCKKGQIKRAVYTIIGGKCNRQTIEKLLNKARALIREEAGLDKAEERADAIGFLKAQIADESISTKDKLSAHEQLLKIIGIGPYGQTDANDELTRARKIKLAMKQIEDENS